MAPSAITLARGYLAPAVLASFILLWIATNAWWWEGDGDACENDIVLGVGYIGSRAVQGCQVSESGTGAKVIPGSHVTWSDVCDFNATATRHQTCFVVAVASAIHMTGACVACVPFATFVLAGVVLYLEPFYEGCWQYVFHISRFALQVVLFPVSLACVVIMSKLDATTFPFQHSEEQKFKVGWGFWLTMVVSILSGVGAVIEVFCVAVLEKSASNKTANLSTVVVIV